MREDLDRREALLDNHRRRAAGTDPVGCTAPPRSSSPSSGPGPIHGLDPVPPSIDTNRCAQATDLSNNE
jgi:hypothetical protein